MDICDRGRRVSHLRPRLRRAASKAALVRAEEAQAYAQLSVPELDTASQELRTLTSAIDSFPLRWCTEEPLGTGLKIKRTNRLPRSPQDLPDSVLATLYLSGIPLNLLLQTLSLRPALTWRATPLREAPDALDSLASELRDWRPELPRCRARAGRSVLGTLTAYPLAV
jgi:hypothetical protein